MIIVYSNKPLKIGKIVKFNWKSIGIFNQVGMTMKESTREEYINQDNRIESPPIDRGGYFYEVSID
jgi:hypothetical protein